MLIKSENPSGEYMSRVKLSPCYKHDCVEGMFLFCSSQEGLIEVHSKYFMVIFKGKCSGAFRKFSWKKCFLRKMCIQMISFEYCCCFFLSDSMRPDQLMYLWRLSATLSSHIFNIPTLNCHRATVVIFVYVWHPTNPVSFNREAMTAVM